MLGIIRSRGDLPVIMQILWLSSFWLYQVTVCAKSNLWAFCWCTFEMQNGKLSLRTMDLEGFLLLDEWSHSYLETVVTWNRGKRKESQRHVDKYITYPSGSVFRPMARSSALPLENLLVRIAGDWPWYYQYAKHNNLRVLKVLEPWAAGGERSAKFPTLKD